MGTDTKKPPAVSLTNEQWEILLRAAGDCYQHMKHITWSEYEDGKITQDDHDEQEAHWNSEDAAVHDIIAQVQEQTGVTVVQFGIPEGVNGVIEGVTITCLRCGKRVKGTLTRDRDGNPIDSSGFMRFDKGDVCDDCLRAAGLDPDQEIL
jgi:hypothetical protein